MRSAVVCLVITLVAACGDDTIVQGVSCKSDKDCKITGAQGTCQSDGFCAYPDTTCVDGLRYTAGAGTNSEQCVGGTVNAACGMKDQACCTGDICGADLTCANSMCVCGEKDQACCGGTVCSGNLACSSEGACTCGGIHDPCCGGTTCDSGLTCEAGSCTSTVEDVAIGNKQICLVLGDKTVECWGRDDFQYARAFPAKGTPTIDTLTPRKIANATDVAEIRAGENHTCIKKTDGTLWCWGRGENGQLGNGTNTSSTSAVQVTGLSAVTLFDLGRMHTCAVGTVGGTNGLYCWGRGGRRTHSQTGSSPVANEGRLGTGNTNDANAPAAVDMSAMASAGQTVVAIAAAGYHTCAAMSDVTVWCWGSPNNGQLGNNTNNTPAMVPTKVDFTQLTIAGGTTIAELTAGFGYDGSNNNCMRLSDNTVYCWGPGGHGQNGINNTNAVLRPATAVTTTALGGATFKQLAPLFDANCGLDTNGLVWCWGREIVGELGNNNAAWTRNSNQLTPVQVVGITGATKLFAGHRNACVLDGAKKLWCWGNNRRGQLSRTPPASIAEVAKLTPIQIVP